MTEKEGAFVDIDVAEIALRLIEKSGSLNSGKPIRPRPPGTPTELLDWLAAKDEANQKMVTYYVDLANHVLEYFIEAVEPATVDIIRIPPGGMQ